MEFAVRMFAMISVISVLGLVGGCAVEKRPLRASMPDDELRATINQHFHAGMGEAEVRNELGNLCVRDENIRVYEAQEARPRVVLARVWPAGGRWINDATGRLDWIDLAFVMKKPDLLEDVRAFHDWILYSHDGARLSGPSRVHLPTSWCWPSAIPIPDDPLVGAESVLMDATGGTPR